MAFWCHLPSCHTEMPRRSSPSPRVGFASGRFFKSLSILKAGRDRKNLSSVSQPLNWRSHPTLAVAWPRPFVPWEVGGVDQDTRAACTCPGHSRTVFPPAPTREPSRLASRRLDCHAHLRSPSQLSLEPPELAGPRPKVTSLFNQCPVVRPARIGPASCLLPSWVALTARRSLRATCVPPAGGAGREPKSVSASLAPLRLPGARR